MARSCELLFRGSPPVALQVTGPALEVMTPLALRTVDSRTQRSQHRAAAKHALREAFQRGVVLHGAVAGQSAVADARARNAEPLSPASLYKVLDCLARLVVEAPALADQWAAEVAGRWAPHEGAHALLRCAPPLPLQHRSHASPPPLAHTGPFLRLTCGTHAVAPPAAGAEELLKRQLTVCWLTEFGNALDARPVPHHCKLWLHALARWAPDQAPDVRQRVAARYARHDARAHPPRPAAAD